MFPYLDEAFISSSIAECSAHPIGKFASVLESWIGSDLNLLNVLEQKLYCLWLNFSSIVYF